MSHFSRNTRSSGIECYDIEKRLRGVVAADWTAIPWPPCNYCRPYTGFDVYAETENDKAATEGFLVFRCSKGPVAFGFRIPTLYRTILSAKRLNCKTELQYEHHANIWSCIDPINENVATIKSFMLTETERASVLPKMQERNNSITPFVSMAHHNRFLFLDIYPSFTVAMVLILKHVSEADYTLDDSYWNQESPVGHSFRTLVSLGKLTCYLLESSVQVHRGVSKLAIKKPDRDWMLSPRRYSVVAVVACYMFTYCTAGRHVLRFVRFNSAEQDLPYEFLAKDHYYVYCFMSTMPNRSTINTISPTSTI
ncbi:hypothetical protein QTP88_009578 [Uroleucon formosanum]